jgi:predicted SAM-dependent methyltransferase
VLSQNIHVVNLKEYIDQKNIDKVRLHLGCGGETWQDFINVDMHPYDHSIEDSSRSGCVADVFADMRALGLPDNSIDEIFTYHTKDHFTRWEAIDMFEDWLWMRKPGGTVIIEVADFARCVLWLFHPNKEKRLVARNQFYGNQWDRLDFETHRYVWSAPELTGALRDIGFRKVSHNHATLTHYPGRDMRVVAYK